MRLGRKLAVGVAEDVEPAPATDEPREPQVPRRPVVEREQPVDEAAVRTGR